MWNFTSSLAGIDYIDHLLYGQMYIDYQVNMGGITCLYRAKFISLFLHRLDYGI